MPYPLDFQGNEPFAQVSTICSRATIFSALHRIKQDELWHFYYGSPICIHTIDREGNYEQTNLGLLDGGNACFQMVVKSGWLFGATIEAPDAYGLAGCTVAPGFEFEDFELPSREELIEDYPRLKQIIQRLTRKTPSTS